jgi:porphobilinogen synthase
LPSFPQARPRRLRRTAALRRSLTETRLAPAALVLPLFVKEGLAAPEPVASMPGVEQHTSSSAAELARRAQAAGVGGVLLFGIPARKDDEGSVGWARRWPGADRHPGDP